MRQLDPLIYLDAALIVIRGNHDPPVSFKSPDPGNCDFKITNELVVVAVISLQQYG